MKKRIANAPRTRWAGGREEGVDRRPRGGIGDASREDGAILILALAYLVAVSLVVAFLSTWATNDLNNSTSFKSANSLTLAATDMTEVAIENVRYNPLISSSQPVYPVHSPVVACWGNESLNAIPVIDGDQIAVWCSTVWNPLSPVTRDVTFDACPISVPAASCVGTNVLLTSEVRFDDYPPDSKGAPIQDLCSTWCGSGMTVVSWQWGSSSAGTVTGKASTLTFTADPSTTTAGGTTTAAVTVTDANGNPVAGDSVALSELSGPSPGIGLLTAVTNDSGVAEFTNIVPQSATTPGNQYILTAVDGNARGNSTPFTVLPKRSTFYNVSAVPAGATVNGTYVPSASATSGDAVKITLDPGSTGCTLGPIANVLTVTFKAPGTCMLDFNDPGNANYSQAFQMVQSIPVGGLAATNVTLALSTTSPAASSTTNVGVTMTLRNASGGSVPSSGTTTLILSDVGSGLFSLTQGATGASSLTVTFPNGASTETAYFSNVNVGSDTISAVNGTVVWGTAGLTVQGGAAAQVVITSSPSSPTVSSVTNTPLTFQLEDKYGNTATSNGTTTLALTSTGNGFFAASTGATGAASLNITFANQVGTATAFFGGETSGVATVTAKNGANSWGTLGVNLAPGAPTSVQLTLNPTSPAKKNVTNATVSLQLFDQFGNAATTSGVQLTLTNSGAGFFATKPGIGGASTLVLTTSAGAATGYFGDNTVQADTITATGPSFSVTSPSFNV